MGLARFYGYARHAQTVALARVLMKAGADKGRRGTERGPAVLRREPRRGDVVLELLAAAADVELTDPETASETALHTAAAFGWPAIVDLLVAHGAEPRSVIEAAGIGDLSNYNLGELSDRDRANALPRGGG